MLSAAVEFWVIVQVLVDLILIILFIIFMKQFRAISAKRTLSDIEPLHQVLEPLLKEADKVAGQFETQLKEKQGLVRRLNEHLDSRIISLNLLLSRAEACLASHEKESWGENRHPRHVYDLQQEIIDLMEKGLTAQEIADRMGISKGEVTLVLELKRKFQEMGESN
jgi:DNA-binding transcriptional regulator GbsR (MarR family)